MNDLTIVFLARVADRVDCAPIILEKLRQELFREKDKMLHEYCLESTAYLSARGKGLDTQIRQWMQSANGLTKVEEIDDLFKRLNRIEKEAQDLRRETQFELSCPGRLDPEKLHIVFYDEQRQVIERLLKAISLELFRLLVSGGAEVLQKLPHFRFVHPKLHEYYQYYADSVIPALMTIDKNKRYGVWSYQYKAQAKLGNMVKLPVFVETVAKAEKKPPILGEQLLSGSGSSMSWQGVGKITNVTPETVVQAQTQGVRGKIKANMLLSCNPQDSPHQVLDQCFVNQWYAIDAADYFAEFTTAMCSKTISRRKMNGQCFYCGADGANAFLCVSCISKVKQRI